MKKFLVVDFETTGNKAKEGDQIIQVGAVLIENKQIVSEYSTLVNPGVKIPPFIQQLTGITNEMVQQAPFVEDILPDLLSLLDGSVLVAHNVFFDLGFLQYTLSSCGYNSYDGPILDTVELSRLLLPNQTGYRLSDLSMELDVEHENPHQADSDALATAQILIALVEKLDRLPYPVLQRLGDLTKGFSSNVGDLIHSIEQQRLNKGTLEREDDDNFDYYRQIVLRKASSEVHSKKMIESENYEELLEELQKILPTEMPGFEWRDAQQVLMERIYAAFSGAYHLLVEAGTGTGKSLAYLIPTFYWARESNEKIVIGTHTIQLQEQLFTRDIPMLQRIFGRDIHVSLFKGRNNYLCLRKYELSLSDHAIDNYDVLLSKGQILTWLTDTTTGDVEELNLPSGGQAYWRQVQSDANSCLNRACPWFSRCFYHQARQKAQQAEVIITNHSLMLTDVRAEQRILPAYSYAIIDEAHHFEDVASHHLGESLHSLQMDALFTDLYSDKGTGMIEKLTKEMDQSELNLHVKKEQLTITTFDITEARERVKQMFQKLFNWGIRTAKEGTESGRLVRRFDSEHWLAKAPNGVEVAIEEAIKGIDVLVTSLGKIYEELHQAKELTYSLRGLLTDLHGVIRECQGQRNLLQQLLLEQKVDCIYWMELDTRSNRKAVRINMVPMDVGPLLQEQFFTKKESVVLTSATLSVNQSFSYVIKRMGLQTEKVETEIHDSPFDYQKQALLCVPADLPSLNAGNEEQFIEQITDSLIQTAMATNGRMLVLFTSHQMLRRVYEGMKNPLTAEGYCLLGHGIDSSSRSKLTKQFKMTSKSVLLGSSSFWEGVDIPGDDLSCLVIVRLPFWPPTHPVVEARSEHIKRDKGNPFMELSIPQAVIRFKQGFGRLVRSRTDRGVVLVFDKRLVEARYGKYFIKSLPETTLHYKPFDELIPLIKNWLG
ncbi:ATP-dependent DNA helicase DinG [Ammoniphilus resinae]|uniref:3'-5' exonuclease DinG n=1 Tax=Ammoniphilus resinae TaxID=861532 RepID=A0ABS4GT00_9BACL|nr:ATP-dependent DNA helicase DinG [Ammoniphilus resinae]MBP1933405.1 ATP-dependent DNA helicase DinG [Ammoniphilus resinae]